MVAAMTTVPCSGKPLCLLAPEKPRPMPRRRYSVRPLASSIGGYALTPARLSDWPILVTEGTKKPATAGRAGKVQTDSQVAAPPWRVI